MVPESMCAFKCVKGWFLACCAGLCAGNRVVAATVASSAEKLDDEGEANEEVGGEDLRAGRAESIRRKEQQS